MEIQTEDILLEKCRKLIESKLAWGDSNNWTSQDYQMLSKIIAESTNVNLSVATLKRIWGKVKYDSKPTINTLNTLAQYLGSENWRAFRQEQNTYPENGHSFSDEIPPEEEPVSKSKKNKRLLLAAASVLIIVAITSLSLINQNNVSSSVDASKYQFSSKKVVDVGLPNTVIFDYDASAASGTDSIFIQQSWDKQLSRLVDRDQKQHTSIYYYPGFFEAKLRINQQVVKEHHLHIKTQEWTPIVDHKPVPVYFHASDAVNDGKLKLELDKIKEFNIPLQPEPPWTSYYFVNDLGPIFSDDFIFETELKNEYSEGAAVCQFTEVRLLFEGASLVIPLAIKGCTSELTFEKLSGKKTDLSAFGVDFSDWVQVKAEIRNQDATIFINDKKAMSFTTSTKGLKLVGLAFRFQGTGSVNSIVISKHSGELMFKEEF